MVGMVVSSCITVMIYMGIKKCFRKKAKIVSSHSFNDDE